MPGKKHKKRKTPSTPRLKGALHERFEAFRMRTEGRDGTSGHFADTFNRVLYKELLKRRDSAVPSFDDMTLLCGEITEHVRRAIKAVDDDRLEMERIEAALIESSYHMLHRERETKGGLWPWIEVQMLTPVGELSKTEYALLKRCAPGQFHSDNLAHSAVIVSVPRRAREAPVNRLRLERLTHFAMKRLRRQLADAPPPSVTERLRERLALLFMP